MKTLKRSYQNPIPVDDDVKVLQRYLNYVRSKYHCSWVYLDQIDGQFGKDTDAAVRAFQTFANIKVDGRVGTETWSTLRNLASATTFLKAAPSGSSLSQPQMQNEASDSTFDFIAGKIVSPLATYLNDISKHAIKQIEILSKHPTKITKNDINRIVRGTFNKPDIAKMEQQFKKQIIDWFHEQAHGNTNAINYRNDPRTLKKLQETGNAQRMGQKAKLLGDRVYFDSKTINARNKKIYDEVVNRCMKELNSVNFSQKINQAIKKYARMPKGAKISGGGILTAISLLPIIKDIIMVFKAAFTDQPVGDLIKKLVVDIIKFAFAAVIGAIISYIVLHIGLVGGIAILVMIVLAIIVNIILACFLPEDFYENMAEKIINGINQIIHNPAFITDTPTFA